MTEPLGPSERFKTEATLVNCFLSAVDAGKSTFGGLEVTTEWNHKAGFVDVLARDSSNALIAFEAKLHDWKRAFLQAYKNTAYANRTYVVMPDNAARRALQYESEFKFRGIGLCAIGEGEVRVLIEACEQEPLLSWVRRLAHQHFDGSPADSSAERPCSSARAVPHSETGVSE